MLAPGTRYTEAVTVFYELSGDAARVRLKAFTPALTALGWDVELLESTTQQNLFLLLCRGADATPLPGDIPTGVRVWQFRRAA